MTLRARANRRGLFPWPAQRAGRLIARLPVFGLDTPRDRQAPGPAPGRVGDELDWCPPNRRERVRCPQVEPTEAPLEIPHDGAGARSEHPGDLGQARDRVIPVVHRERARHEVERCVVEREPRTGAQPGAYAALSPTPTRRSPRPTCPAYPSFVGPRSLSRAARPRPEIGCPPRIATSAASASPRKNVFEQKDVEVPAFWSQLATNVVVSKYFRGVNLYRDGAFATQRTWQWCIAAGVPTDGRQGRQLRAGEDEPGDPGPVQGAGRGRGAVHRRVRRPAHYDRSAGPGPAGRPSGRGIASSPST
jgi:hypothetical protein